MYYNKKYAVSELCKRFTIYKNDCLDRDVTGFYHCDYIGYKKVGNPDFINTLKNQFSTTPEVELKDSLQFAKSYFIKFFYYLLKVYPGQEFVVVMVPRAKNENYYSRSQRYFKSALYFAIDNINNPLIKDGTEVIKRNKDTRTTHLNIHDTEGDMPYRGITNATCSIDTSKIKNKMVLLIDDIYTKTVNIDEDCIQYLYDNGAKEVIFYAIAKTQKSN